MECLGSTAETTLTRWQQARSIILEFNIGATEAKAALNLALHCSPYLVDTLQNLVMRYGFHKGPITHEAVACSVMCINEGPKITTSSYWTLNLRTDTYTSKLIADRVMITYDEMPDKYKRPFNENDIVSLQAVCACFSFAYRICAVLCDQETLTAEWPGIEEQFKLKYLDGDLEDEIKKCVEPWHCVGVTVIQSLIAKTKTTVEKDREQRDAALADSLRALNLQQVIEHLEQDQTLTDEWKKQCATLAHDDIGKAKQHIKTRYDNGLKKVQEFMDCRLNAKILKSLAHGPAEWSVMKQGLLKSKDANLPALAQCPPFNDILDHRMFLQVPTHPHMHDVSVHLHMFSEYMVFLQPFSQVCSHMLATYSTIEFVMRYVINIIDFSTLHNPSVTESAIKCCADICHQDPKNVAFILYPLSTVNNHGERKIKAEHQLDERLMAHKLSIDHEGSIHYEVSDEHAGDRRPLSQRYRLCFSKSFEKNNPWLKSKGCRGKLARIPYIRVRDMVRTQDPVFAISDEIDVGKVSPEERAAQRGVQSWKAILESLLDGMPRADTDKYSLVEILPWKFAEVIHSTWHILKGSPGSPFSCLSLFLDDDDFDANLKKLRTTLMTEWWDNHADAGHREYPGLAQKPDPPALRMCRWERDTAIFPTSVLERFPEGSDEYFAVKKMLAIHEQKYGVATVPGPAVVGPLPLNTSPDLTIEPIPRTMDDTFELEQGDLDEMCKPDNVSAVLVLIGS